MWCRPQDCLLFFTHWACSISFLLKKASVILYTQLIYPFINRGMQHKQTLGQISHFYSQRPHCGDQRPVQTNPQFIFPFVLTEPNCCHQRPAHIAPQLPPAALQHWHPKTVNLHVPLLPNISLLNINAFRYFACSCSIHISTYSCKPARSSIVFFLNLFTIRVADSPRDRTHTDTHTHARTHARTHTHICIYVPYNMCICNYIWQAQKYMLPQ